MRYGTQRAQDNRLSTFHYATEQAGKQECKKYAKNGFKTNQHILY